MCVQSVHALELLPDQPVEGKDLAIMCVTRQHETDARRDGMIPTERPVIEKHLEALRIEVDIPKFTADLILIFGIINANQLQLTDADTLISQHHNAGIFQHRNNPVGPCVTFVITDGEINRRPEVIQRGDILRAHSSCVQKVASDQDDIRAQRVDPFNDVVKECAAS